MPAFCWPAAPASRHPPKPKTITKKTQLLYHAQPPEDLREVFHQGSARLQGWFLDSTRREARTGAHLAVWPETNLLVLQQDERAFLERAQALARDEQIHLLIGMGTVYLGVPRPLENKAVLIGQPWDLVRWAQHGIFIGSQTMQRHNQGPDSGNVEI